MSGRLAQRFTLILLLSLLDAASSVKGVHGNGDTASCVWGPSADYRLLVVTVSGTVGSCGYVMVVICIHLRFFMCFRDFRIQDFR